MEIPRKTGIPRDSYDQTVCCNYYAGDCIVTDMPCFVAEGCSWYDKITSIAKLRECKCGAVLSKRERMCIDCKKESRRKTMRKWRAKKTVKRISGGISDQ